MDFHRNIRARYFVALKNNDSFKPHYVNVIVKEIFLFQCQGVTFSDYLDFFNLLLHMRDVEMALSFHTVAGQAIDKGEIFYDCRYFL